MVELQKPADLQQAMSYAKEAELAAIVATGRSSRGRLILPPAGPAVATPAAAPRPTTATGPCHRFKRLTPKEMAEKRRRQECYFCIEKYTADHKCAPKGVYLLELDEDAD